MLKIIRGLRGPGGDVPTLRHRSGEGVPVPAPRALPCQAFQRRTDPTYPPGRSKAWLGGLVIGFVGWLLAIKNNRPIESSIESSIESIEIDRNDRNSKLFDRTQLSWQSTPLLATGDNLNRNHATLRGFHQKSFRNCSYCFWPLPSIPIGFARIRGCLFCCLALRLPFFLGSGCRVMESQISFDS